MWKAHEIPISGSTNKVLLEYTNIHLHIIYSCFSIVTTELTHFDRDYVAHKAKKNSLSGHLQKKFTKG